MDGVEIAESLLYKDFEKFSSNKLYTKSVADVYTYYNVNKNYGKSLLDHNDMKVQIKNPNCINLSEFCDNSFIESKNDVNGELLDRLIQQLNTESKNNEYNFRPITPKLESEYKMHGNVSETSTYLPNNKKDTESFALASSLSIGQNVTNNILQDLIVSINNSNLKNICKDNLLLSNPNTATNNTLSYSELSNYTNVTETFDKQTRADPTQYIKIMDNATIKEKKANCTKNENNSINNSVSTTKIESLNQTSIGKLPSLKTEPISIPQGSYIFIPLNLTNNENKSRQNDINPILPVFTDSPISNINKYFITCCPIITQLQDLKVNSTKLTPMLVPKGIFTQSSLSITNNNTSSIKVKNDHSSKKETNMANESINRHKRIESNELSNYLDCIVESHQLLIREKNKIILERYVMKDDKFKGFMSFNGKYSNSMSKLERELHSLINTLFEINVLISKIETGQNIHFIEPFYQILQNSAELIQNFQYNLKDDSISKIQNSQIEKETQNKINKLKQLYVYIQEIRSFLWASMQNINENQDSSAKSALRLLKNWVEEKKKFKNNVKFKESLKFIQNNATFCPESNNMPIRNQLKPDSLNFGATKFGIPVGTRYQAVNHGNCISPANSFINTPPNQMPGNQHYNIIRTSAIPNISQSSIVTTPTVFIPASNPCIPTGLNNQIKTAVAPNFPTQTNLAHGKFTTTSTPVSTAAFGLPYTIPSASQQLYTATHILPNLQNTMSPRNFLITPSNMMQSIIYQNNGHPSIINNGTVNYMVYKTNPQII